MPIVPFRGGAAFGFVIDGVENLETTDDAYLPIQSITNEDEQEVLFPILIGEPSIWAGSFADITVEDVPGAFGVSGSNTFNFMVYHPSSGNATLLVWRDGYNPASGVVLSVSSDNGATWTHTAAVDYDGGNTASKIPGNRIPATNGKALLATRSTLTDSFSAQDDNIVASLDSLATELVQVDLLTGLTSRLALSGVVGGTDITSVHNINGKYLVTQLFGSNLRLFVNDDNSLTSGNWTNTFTTTENDYSGYAANGEDASDIQFFNGTYYWAARETTGAVDNIIIRRSTDLINWTTIDTTGTSAVANNNYAFPKLVKLEDDSLAMFFKFSSFMFSVSFDDNGITSTEDSHLNQWSNPILGFIDQQACAFNFDAIAIDGVFINLNMPYAELDKRTAVTFPGSSVIPDQPCWRDRKDQNSFLFYKSFTNVSGVDDLILTLFSIPDAEVRSVENYGNTHSLASTFLRGV